MKGKAFVNTAVIYLIGDLISRIGQLLLVPIFARTLTTSEYGLVAATSLITTLVATVSGFSLNAAALKQIPRGQEACDRNNAATTIALGALGLSVIFGILMMVAGPWLLAKGFRDYPVATYGRIGILTGCLVGPTNVFLAILQANYKAVQYRVVTFTSFIVGVLSSIIFVCVFKQGAFGAILGPLVGALAGFGVAVFSAKLGATRTVDSKALKTACAIGLPLTIYGVGGFVTNHISRLFVERYLSMSDLGVYNVAQLYCTALPLLFGAINTAWVPYFYNTADADDATVQTGRYGTMLVICALGLYGIMAILSKDVLNIIVGVKYARASDIIPLLLLNSFLSSVVWTIVMNPLVLKDRSWTIAFTSVISGGTNVVCNIWLTQKVGMWGAAFSSTISLVILNGVTGVISLRAYRVRYHFRRLVVAAACTAAACLCAIEMGAAKDWITYSLKASIVLGVIFVTYILTRNGSHEIR